VAGLLSELSEPRTVMRGVGIAGAAVGIGFAMAPRLGLRVMGLEADGRGVSLLARLFASRDITLGVALLRAAGREPLERQWLDVIAAFQVVDLAFSAALWRTGRLSRRAWVVVLGTATPTLVAAVAARTRVAGKR
jgi:hypothetical protein